jgi:hypothetical protein
MRHAAVSIVSNVAEGSTTANSWPLPVARFSSYKPQLELAARLHPVDHPVDEVKITALTDQCEEVARLINRLLAKLAK